ncbi:fructosamine kinase PKL/CAK/FruK [Sanghuangporus baumii]|uniref:protein-ribulosamine 3-kinase n=1 Tax=Sanghuangporus baumii TaxID=108892 RepID=A0A9Q5I0Z4_SANBA|nr:fructosamine kinase PKL/CAK/FruK [Sanghuangporus baumii]
MVARILSQKLSEIEPGAKFLFNLPIVTSASSGKKYYAKCGRRSEREQYIGEIESLKHIYRAAPGLAPKVFHSGVDDDGTPYMISDYLDIRRHDSKTLTKLATRLATELHRYKSEKGFGFDVPTFCGATRLENGWYEKGLQEQGDYNSLCPKIRRVREVVIPHLLRPLKIEPVLLHGDLWSGNTGVDSSTGEPVVYDPSSFYGHNEADLAIARIFGGFGSAFFNKYHELHPKAEPVNQYDLRVDLYELFHYLNHALLFGGGGYAASASQKMDRLLKACS